MPMIDVYAATGTFNDKKKLAVDLASQSGLTLVAFLRGDSMNVYTRPDRIKR